MTKTVVVPETPSQQFQEQKTKEMKIPNFVHQAVAVSALLYIIYSYFGLIAWVSHLGARLPFLQPFLIASGYAKNYPVETVSELFYFNGIAALGFVLPHSFLRPPRLTKYLGLRYARLAYCLMASASCHWLLYWFRPMRMTGNFVEEVDFSYNETENVPLFTLPVPKPIHDFLSAGMVLYSMFCFLVHPWTFIILGFNRAFYGPGSGKDKFPKGLSPRMDIITWTGYAVWLRSGHLGFVLFSGLSILPYKVYLWDFVLRVVAASYLRLRSKGFRIWVGEIEQTHHFIWVLRAAIVAFAVGLQYNFFTQSQEVDENGSAVGSESLTLKSVSVMALSGLGIGLLMDRLEKLK